MNTQFSILFINYQHPFFVKESHGSLSHAWSQMHTLLNVEMMWSCANNGNNNNNITIIMQPARRYD